MNRVPLVPKAQVDAREKQLRSIAEAEAKLAAVDKGPRSKESDRKRGELIAERDRLKRARFRSSRPSRWPYRKGNSGRSFSQSAGRANPHSWQLTHGSVRSSGAACRDSLRVTLNRPFVPGAAGASCALGRVGGEPADGTRHRQSRLAMALRRGPRAHAEQLRHALRVPNTPETPRSAGGSLRRGRLVLEDTPQAHHAVSGVPTSERRG